MTEEIKELLDILNKVKDYDDKRYFISCGENDYLLTNDEIKCLLNYITNLQKENENLLYEINGYLKEKEKLKEKINKLEDYKQRNEKAVEYLKYQISNLDFEKDIKAKMLGAMAIVILEGGDE